MIDCFSRRLVGWSVADHMRTSLVTDALRAAEATRGSLAGAVFHSDHGAQYTSREFADVCAELGVRQSMGAVGTSADNALAESFNAALKRETLRGARRRTSQVRFWCIADRALYVIHAGEATALLTAVNLTDGTVLWQHPLDAEAATVPVEEQDIVLLTDRRGHTHAFDTANGTERWQHGTGQRITTAPTVHHGRVFVAAWAPHHLVCLNTATGKEEWRRRGAGALTARPFIVDDLVYAADRTGTLTGWNVNTGRRILHVTDLLWDPAIQGEPVVHQNVLYVATRRGHVRALKLP